MAVGPMVTNLGTRDTTVLASLFATLDSMYPGRTACAMGRGDSALRHIGRRPAPLSAVVDAMGVMRALFAGREADRGGTSVSIPWQNDAGSELPIWVTAYGPKALDTGGRHADGFVLQLADPKILEWTLQAVRDASEDEGRDHGLRGDASLRRRRPGASAETSSEPVAAPPSASAPSFEGRPVEAVGGGDRLVGHLSLDDVDAGGEGRVAFRRRSPAAVGDLQGIGHRRVG